MLHLPSFPAKYQTPKHCNTILILFHLLKNKNMMHFTTLSLLLALGSVYGYSGDMTFYAPGLGACGQYHGGGDWIVAMVCYIKF